MIKLKTILVSLLLVWAAEVRAGSPPMIGIYGGGNNETQVRGADAGVDFFYPSIHWYENHSWLTDLVAFAQKNGIKVYPSLAGAYDGYQDKHHAFAAAHPEFWEKRIDGTVMDRGEFVNLSWGHPEVRKFKVEAFTKLVADAGVDGICLDYTRFFGNDSGYSPVIVEAFKKADGRDPFKIPTDDPKWVQFRADLVTSFVRDLRESLGGLGRNIELIACVNPDPDQCLRDSLQDWAGWLDQGLIDGVAVMIYERDTNNTMALLQKSKGAIRGRVPLTAILAPEYDNLPTPELIREGSRKALQAGADAVAYYHEGSVIRLQLWDAVKEVANWNVEEIRAEPINYLLNSGFERELQNWAVGDGRGIEVVESNGGNALRMDLSSVNGLRQVIDRGLISDGKAVRLAGRIKLESPAAAKLQVDLTLTFHDRDPISYRVPVPVTPSADWQTFEVATHLPDAKKLNFIYASIQPAGGSGQCLLDDMELNIVPGEVSPKQGVAEPGRPIKSVEGVNIARGQAVHGTSFWENGFDYDNAVDGDLSTVDYGRNAAWHSQRPALDQSITIYLPKTHLITRIRLLNASAEAAYRTDEFKIEVSTDARGYRPVASGRLPDDGTTWTEIKLPPTAARYIRFTGVRGFNLTHAVGLKEIEVY